MADNFLINGRVKNPRGNVIIGFPPFFPPISRFTTVIFRMTLGHYWIFFPFSILFIDLAIFMNRWSGTLTNISFLYYFGFVSIRTLGIDICNLSGESISGFWIAEWMAASSQSFRYF